MNVEKYHQIANPEILDFLKIQKSFILRREAKLVLKGILIAQEKEYKFLEDLCWILQDVLAKETAKLINKRLEALKISNEDLWKVLK